MEVEIRYGVDEMVSVYIDGEKVLEGFYIAMETFAQTLHEHGIIGLIIKTESQNTELKGMTWD